MEVHLMPEQEAELGKLATSKSRNANELAQKVIGFYLEHEARFIEAVKRGLESLDRGDYVSREEVGAHIDPLFPFCSLLLCEALAARTRSRFVPAATSPSTAIAKNRLSVSFQQACLGESGASALAPRGHNSGAFFSPKIGPLAFFFHAVPG